MGSKRSLSSKKKTRAAAGQSKRLKNDDGEAVDVISDSNNVDEASSASGVAELGRGARTRKPTAKVLETIVEEEEEDQTRVRGRKSAIKKSAIESDEDISYSSSSMPSDVEDILADTSVHKGKGVRKKQKKETEMETDIGIY